MSFRFDFDADEGQGTQPEAPSNPSQRTNRRPWGRVDLTSLLLPRPSSVPPPDPSPETDEPEDDDDGRLHLMGETLTLPRLSPADAAPVKIYRRSLADVRFAVASGEAVEVVAGATAGVQKAKGSVSDSEVEGLEKWLEKVVLGDSDLVEGDYEGGFKTWECSLDLVSFLAGDNQALFSGKRVLELGCGSGLPGIFCMLGGASHVDLQDYNEEVIRLLTFPNVLLNLAASMGRTSAAYPVADGGGVPWKTDKKGTFEVDLHPSLLEGRGGVGFLKGDWGLQELDGETYDLVLTSETIYSAESMVALYDAIEKSLSRPSGIALVAAKTSYFGCSGSLQDFLALVKTRNVFQAETVWQQTQGVAREIVKLSFK
ncbi:Histidine protein methyltransferase 1 [Phlyctochytrium bullatum]|nr:Histidine protein methyltransferase 1 [Phlyctochytrium bullatum]